MTARPPRRTLRIRLAPDEWADVRDAFAEHGRDNETVPGFVLRALSEWCDSQDDSDTAAGGAENAPAPAPTTGA